MLAAAHVGRRAGGRDARRRARAARARAVRCHAGHARRPGDLRRRPLSGGDGEDAGAHLIEVKREMRELGDRGRALDGDMAAARSHHGSLRNAIAQRQAAIDSTRSDAHEREIGAGQGRERPAARRRERARSRARIDKPAAGSRALATVLQAAATKSCAAQAERSERRAGQRLALERRARARRTKSTARAARGRRAERRGHRGARARGRAKQRVEGDHAVVERLSARCSSWNAREARLSDELREFARQQGELAGRVARDREQLAERMTRRCSWRQVSTLKADLRRGALAPGRARARAARRAHRRSRARASCGPS